MLENYLKNAVSKTFFITPTTSEKVEDAIGTLNNGKSNSPKSVPTFILFKTSPSSALINKCFESGIFPRIFEMEGVVPVFKSESRLFCNNIDPILVLSNITKILEKLVQQWLYQFLDQKKCFYNLQLNFRFNISSTTD